MVGFILSCIKNQPTYQQWATQIGLLSGKVVSKQAVFDRVGSNTVEFCRQLLAHALEQSIGACKSGSLFGAFGQVLLQDSTTLKLPQTLSKIFPGNRCRGEQKAIARIQCILNIKEMNFIQLSLRSFIQNDQSASSEILPYCQRGDLVIRDLGYFALSAFSAMINKEIHFVSRLRYGVRLYDLKGNEITLNALFKHKGSTDRWVYIGAEQKIKVRLVMIPLPAPQVAARRRKARRDRDRRLNHSQAYYQWMGYTVLITTVSEDIWTTSQIAQVYKVRWQIEIIFKSWKSGFNLQVLLHERCTHEDRVKTSIYLLLLFICLFMQKIYLRYRPMAEEQFDQHISLLKLARFVTSNMAALFCISGTILKKHIVRHCTYEKRYDRINMVELLGIF